MASAKVGNGSGAKAFVAIQFAEDIVALRAQLKPANLGPGLAQAIGSVVSESAGKEPIKLVHVSPKTLGAFAEKIQDGFSAITTSGLPINASTIVDNDEAPDVFADRVAPQLQGADVILLEVHGAEQEVRIMETIIAKGFNGKLIILVHRPEEMVLRIKKEEFVSTQEAKRILADRLSRADAIAVLGESTINRYAEMFPGVPVVSILHPYFDAHNMPDTPNRYNEDSVVVVGSNTTWGEMRDIEDVEGLMEKIGTRINAVGYIAGKFQSEHVDMEKYIARQNDDVIFLTNGQMVSARSRGEFSDEKSFRNWIYRLSENGRKLIIRADIDRSGKTFKPSDLKDKRLREVMHWEGRLVDFNLQLYKENLGYLRDEDQKAPKEEYSGTLHKGLAEIFLVLKSPTMDDVGQGEGLEMIEVESQTRRPDFTEAANRIVELVRDPEQRLGILRRNYQVAKSNGVENAAYGYLRLSQYLLEGQGLPVVPGQSSLSSVNSVLQGMRIPEVRRYLERLVKYMYGAYGVAEADVERMIAIIAGSQTSEEAVEGVYKAGFEWNNPANPYGAKYRAYKTGTDPDIRSDAVRQFVWGSVVFDIATGNTSMFNKVIGPIRGQITSARGSDIVVNVEQLREIQTKAAENGIEFLPQSLDDPGKLPEGIEDYSVDTVTIVGALHHMTDEIRTSILQEAYRILKPDGRLVVLEDAASNINPVTFPSGTYKEEVRQELLDDFIQMSRENQNYIFGLVDWMGNHLIPGDTSIPLSFNFKTREEWHEIFREAGFEVEAESNPGVTPYKFHTHPELIFSLRKSSHPTDKVRAFVDFQQQVDKCA